MLTRSEIAEIVNRIEYRGWIFKVGPENDLYLQVGFWADGEFQQARKWRLSPHMIPSEIVRTAWKAVLAAEEHEAAEKFRYLGQQVMNPHLDYDQMADWLASGSRIVGRPLAVKDL